MRPRISFDIDGVIAGGNYLPEWDRKPEIYLSLPVMDEYTKPVLNELDNKCDIYYLTSRTFDGDYDITLEWMINNNIPLGKGLVCRVPGDDKHKVSAALGCDLHIDDRPATVRLCGFWGILFVGRDAAGWWPGTEEAMKVCKTARNWKQLNRIIRVWNNMGGMEVV